MMDVWLLHSVGSFTFVSSDISQVICNGSIVIVLRPHVKCFFHDRGSLHTRWSYATNEQRHLLNFHYCFRCKFANCFVPQNLHEMKYYPIPSALYRLLRVTTRSRLSRRVCAKSEPYRNGQVGKYEEEKKLSSSSTTVCLSMSDCQQQTTNK